MSIDYASILKLYGFPKESDLHDTVTGFVYDINGVLFDNDSPFEGSTSETITQPTDLNNLILCKLTLKPGFSISRATHYLVSTWFRWLRYSDPLLEHIETKTFRRAASVRMLTMSRGSACTVHFLIKG